MGAEAYLRILQKEGVGEEEKKKAWCEARWYVRKAIFWGNRCKTYFGWAQQVKGTYLWLKGKKEQAVRSWDRGIEFLRKHTEDKYRLGRVLLEEGKFLIKEERLKEKGRKDLEEARRIFKELEVTKKDLKETEELLGVKEEKEYREEETVTLAEEGRRVSLLKVSHLISSILDLDQLLEKILEISIKATGAERGFLLLYN